MGDPLRRNHRGLDHNITLIGGGALVELPVHAGGLPAAHIKVRLTQALRRGEPVGPGVGKGDGSAAALTYDSHVLAPASIFLVAFRVCRATSAGVMAAV